MRVRHAIAEREIRPGRIVWRRAGDVALLREQRLQERRGVEQLDALAAHHVGDRRDQGIGGLGAQAHQHLQQRPVWRDVGKQLRVLDLARHHGLCAPGLLQQLDASTELAERHGVQRGAECRGPFGQVVARLFLDRHDGDVMPEGGGRVEHEQGKRAVAGNQADRSHGREQGLWPTAYSLQEALEPQAAGRRLQPIRLATRPRDDGWRGAG